MKTRIFSLPSSRIVRQLETEVDVNMKPRIFACVLCSTSEIHLSNYISILKLFDSAVTDTWPLSGSLL